MTEEKKEKNNIEKTDSNPATQDGQKKKVEKTPTDVKTVSKAIADKKPVSKERPKRTFKKNVRPRRRAGFKRPKPEFDQKIIDIRRVTRVVKGGRRFSFSVVMILGNKKGKVGVGVGKASDTALAIEKAIRNAKKNMIQLKLTENNSIPYEVDAKYCASRVAIRPAKGRGVVAGSSLRTVLELAGVTEVGGKVISRSKNKLNNARATIKALQAFKG